jgi:ABC-type lipoprotein release transport system permease subunit
LYDWKSGMVYLMIVGALFGFVIFAWDRAAGLSENERREIGTLKAVGWETAEIIKVKVFEGLIISLSAFLGGFVLAYAHVFFGSSFLFTEFFKGWSVLYPDFSLTPYIDEVQVGTLFLLTVLPYSLATIVPIWRSATTDPAQTLRGE